MTLDTRPSRVVHRATDNNCERPGYEAIYLPGSPGGGAITMVFVVGACTIYIVYIQIYKYLQALHLMTSPVKSCALFILCGCKRTLSCVLHSSSYGPIVEPLACMRWYMYNTCR